MMKPGPIARASRASAARLASPWPMSAMAKGVISAVSASTPAMTAQGPRVVASLSHSVRMRRVIV